jgi:hypothetical protein
VRNTLNRIIIDHTACFNTNRARWKARLPQQLGSQML